jgi:hypothetical protein
LPSSYSRAVDFLLILFDSGIISGHRLTGVQLGEFQGNDHVRLPGD